MKGIIFESSTFCNSRCTFCPRYNMTREMGFMSDDLFHKIIKEGKEMGIKTYYPFMNGEPFIHPKIYEWLDYMEKEKVKVILYTNGELMNVDKLIKYSNINLVNCSFNGATKETYNKLMRGPDFERTRKNIKRLIEKAKFRIQVSMVVTEENIHEKRLFRKMWGKKVRFAPHHNWAGARQSSLRKEGSRVPCIHLLKHINVLWDGRVNLCCADYDGKVILGNLNKQSLKEIIKKIEPLQERHKLLDFNMPLCRKCNYNI